jgi:CO/xanthine dehydrogenase FAD-binding subunit
MLLPKFDFHEPVTIGEACQVMAEHGVKAKLIAGGTDLMVNMKKKLVTPEHVVSIARLEELKTTEKAGAVFKIGACVTVSDLAASKKVNETLGALGAGARALGSPLIRNLATIGGNLGTARPAADLPPSLMAYGSKVVLSKDGGTREVLLDDFFTGPGLTEIQPNEILSEIHVNIPPAGAGAGYMNLGVRKAQDCNLVNVGSYLELDSDGQTIKSARVVMGCVGPTHLRAPSAEKVLIGETASEALFKKAGEAAAGDASPIDDFRGCAAYKRDMVGVLTVRTLGLALGEARNRQ